MCNKMGRNMLPQQVNRKTKCFSNLQFDLRYQAMDRTNDEDEKRIRRRKLIGHDGMDINVASEEDSLELIKQPQGINSI